MAALVRSPHGSFSSGCGSLPPPRSSPIGGMPAGGYECRALSPGGGASPRCAVRVAPPLTSPTISMQMGNVRPVPQVHPLLGLRPLSPAQSFSLLPSASFSNQATRSPCTSPRSFGSSQQTHTFHSPRMAPSISPAVVGETAQMRARVAGGFRDESCCRSPTSPTRDAPLARSGSHGWSLPMNDMAELRARAAARLQAVQASQVARTFAGEDLMPECDSILEGPGISPTTKFVPGGISWRDAPGTVSPPVPPPQPTVGPSSFRFGPSPGSMLRSSASTPSLGGFGRDHNSPQRSNRIITLYYFKGDHPQDELTALDGGQGDSVLVRAVSSQGKAHAAGIRPGHAIVALNGRTEFAKLPGWQVRLLLEPPITVTIDTSPSSETTKEAKTAVSELRLGKLARRTPLGLPLNKSLSYNLGPNGTWEIAEEVIFKREFTDPDAPPDHDLLSGACVTSHDLSNARRRNDRSPLRWLEPVFNQFVAVVCADASDEGDYDDDPRRRRNERRARHATQPREM